MIEVGQQIKKARLKKGWSRNQLAAKIDKCESNHICNIENGKRNLLESKIKEFAKVLGVNIVIKK